MTSTFTLPKNIGKNNRPTKSQVIVRKPAQNQTGEFRDSPVYQNTKLGDDMK